MLNFDQTLICSYVGIVRYLGMIILDNFEESCSYTFRTKYFDPILAWVNEIFVGIILEEQSVSGKRKLITNVERKCRFFVFETEAK